jgi:hypothetical protein
MTQCIGIQPATSRYACSPHVGECAAGGDALRGMARQRDGGRVSAAGEAR